MYVHMYVQLGVDLFVNTVYLLPRDICTGWAEKNVPNFKAILLLNCTAEKAQIWMA